MESRIALSIDFTSSTTERHGLFDSPMVKFTNEGAYCVVETNV